MRCHCSAFVYYFTRSRQFPLINGDFEGGTYTANSGASTNNAVPTGWTANATFECGKMIGTWSANFHQGQRSCAPREQAGHMSALDQLAETSKNLLHRRGRPNMGNIASPWRYDAAA